MVEDDLEHHGGDDEAGEHDGAGELGPLPGGQVDAPMMTFSMISMVQFLVTVTWSSVTVFMIPNGVCVPLKQELDINICNYSI